MAGTLWGQRERSSRQPGASSYLNGFPWQSLMKSVPGQQQGLGPGKRRQRRPLRQGAGVPGGWAGAGGQRVDPWLRNLQPGGKPCGWLRTAIRSAARCPPHRAGRGGKANTSPALVEGRNQLRQHRLIGQRVKLSRRWLSKAGRFLQPCPAKSCCLLVQRPLAGSPVRPSPLQPLCPLHSPPGHYYSPPATRPLLSQLLFDRLLQWLREDQPYGKGMSRCSPFLSSLIFLSCLLSPTFSSSFIL